MTSFGTLTYLPAIPGARPRPAWIIKARPHVMIRVKRMFPRAEQSRAGLLGIVDTPDTSRDVHWLCDRYPLDMDDATGARLAARVGEFTDRQNAIDNILGGAAQMTLAVQPGVPLRGYQLEALAWARAVRRYLLADDLGLGKTISALAVLGEPDALPALVVCPTHLPAQWLRELQKLWPGMFGHAVTKTSPYPLDQIRGHAGQRPDVLVMGYSKLAGWGDALAEQVRTVIFDEVHELRRGTETLKGIAAARVADGADYVIGCSATPVHNYGGEIHSVINILNPDALGARPEFLREWCGKSGPSGQPMVSEPAALGTYLREQGVMLRRTRKDVHRELPEPIRIRQEVESDPGALAEVSDDVLAIARLVLDDTADHKRRFVASGDLDWRLRQATGIGKAPYVAGFVKLLLESEDRVVLFGWHRAVYSIWAEQLADYNPVFYTGTESPTQKAAAVEAFTSGRSRVLIISLRSGAGLDGLQEACSVVVFGELDWSPAAHDQAIGRLARDGQQATVAAYFLVSADGSDPVIDEVLQLKRGQSEPIRDPDAPLLAPVNSDPDRVRMLAQAIIAQASRSDGAVA